MRVIILSTSKYKEKDCIYNALSEEGPLSFKARGAQDSKSQFVWLNNILTVADVEFAEGKYKYPVLKNATLVSSSITGSDKLEYLYSISALAEIAKEVISDDERKYIYSDLLEAVNALKKQADHLVVVLIFLARCTRYAGIELEVDKCVFSGSTSDIVAFSFDEGGFVSRNCLTKEMQIDLVGAQLKLIRYCFKSPDYNCSWADRFSSEDKKVVLNKFIEFIDNNIGVNLTSIKYLIK